MKKSLCVFLAALLTIVLCGCGLIVPISEASSAAPESTSVSSESQDAALSDPESVPEDVPESTPEPSESASDAQEGDELLPQMVGYWNSAQSGDNTILLIAESGGAYTLTFGWWESEWDVPYEITGMRDEGGSQWTMSLHVPAQEATEMRDAVEEYSTECLLDLSELSDGKITITDADNYCFVFAGADQETAYNEYLSRR